MDKLTGAKHPAKVPSVLLLRAGSGCSGKLPNSTYPSAGVLSACLFLSKLFNCRKIGFLLEFPFPVIGADSLSVVGSLFVLFTFDANIVITDNGIHSKIVIRMS